MPLSISNLSVLASAKKGTLVGVLKLTDTAGIELPASFAIQGSTPYFRIPKSNGNLLTDWPPPVVAIPGNYPVVIKGTSKVTPYSVTAQFTVLLTTSSPPPTPPVPTKITFAPATVALKDDAAAGTVLTAVSVSTSDGSAFSGTLSPVQASIIAIISGNRVALARPLNSGDDGSHQWGVSASQNGTTITESFPVTVTPAVVPPPVPKTVVLNPSAVTAQDNAVAGTVLSTVSVVMSDGSAFAGALAIAPVGTVGVSGNNLVLTRGLLASDDGPHSFTVTAAQSGGTATAVLTLQVNTSGGTPVVNIPNSPLPHFGDPTGNATFAPYIEVDDAIDYAVVAGITRIRAFWDYNPYQTATTITMQWMLDDKPISEYIVGTNSLADFPGYGRPLPFNFIYDWDTTGTPDGTHVISARVIDSDLPAYNYQFAGTVVIVQNHGAIDGAQKIAVTHRLGIAGHTVPGRPDFVDYNGVPNSPNAAHSLPVPTVGFIPPLNGDVAGRDVGNWRADDPAEPRAIEYEHNVRFTTTPQGGVFSGNYYPQAGSFVESGSYRYAEQRGGFDGGRCDATLDPYVSYVSAPDGLSWFGAELGGRIVEVGFDGRVTTRYGERNNRALLPYYSPDHRLTEDDVDTRKEFVGSGDLEVGGVNDLCFDPRDPDVFYFVNFLAHYIGKVRNSTGVGTVYAGIPGTSGFTNGAAASATFNNPSSVIMSDGKGNAGPIGTMYVADFSNNCIRMISADGNVVTTLVGKQGLPDDASIAANPAMYNPPGTVAGFDNIYVTHPLVIRFTSAGNVVAGRTQFFAVNELDLGAKTSRWIGNYGKTTITGADPGAWLWLDCDRTGACFALDDILMIVSVGGFSPGVEDAASATWLMSLDGSVARVFSETAAVTVLPVGSPPLGLIANSLGHYPWALAFSRTQARMIGSGFGGNGACMARYKVPSDPAIDWPTGTGINIAVWFWGSYIWRKGTAMGRGHSEFPWNSRPSFSVLRGNVGCGHLGLWPGKNTFDDLNMTFPSTTPGDAGDVALGNYIRSGMGGSVPRPEITGNDMRDLIYFIRRSTLAGSYPTPVIPGPDDPDKTFPVISSVSATRLSATSIRVDWTTDKPTIGFVACGSPNQAAFPGKSYCVFSDIEPGLGTSHSMVTTGLPIMTPTHFSVVSKDYAGNCVHTADAVV